MQEFESAPNSNDSELDPNETRTDFDVAKESEGKFIPEELEQPEAKEGQGTEQLEPTQKEQGQQDMEQIEVIRRELKEMPIADVEMKSSHVVEVPPVDVNNGKKLIERDESIPLTLISTKRLIELLDDYRWTIEDPKVVMKSELEKRGNRNRAAETIFDVCRFVGRTSFHIWNKIRDIGGIHFEERSLEDALQQAQKLKLNPFFKEIATAEEKKIRDKIRDGEKK